MFGSRGNPAFSIMLSYLDPIIFPDECTLLEVAPNRVVYPIFKNGSSALLGSGYQVLDKNAITQVTTIEVFVREPVDRYVSGVQSYLKHLPAELDRNTALYFAKQHLFLNRHYAPQFHWLVNLQRFTRATLKLRPVTDIAEISRNLTPDTINNPPRDQAIEGILRDDPRMHFYLQLDKPLIDLLGKEVSFREICEHTKEYYNEAYQEIIGRSVELCNVLV
jgi:hypothetical protein